MDWPLPCWNQGQRNDHQAYTNYWMPIPMLILLVSTDTRTTMTPCVYAVARAMSSQLQAVPSIGHPNFKPRRPLPLWKLRSLPWVVVAVSSCPSLPLLTKLVLPLVLRSLMTTILIPALCMSLSTKTIWVH